VCGDLKTAFVVFHSISMVLHHQDIRGNILRRDFEEKFDLIVDANDSILERVGCNLDEMSGIRRNPEPILVEAVSSCTRPVSGSWNQSQSGSLSHSSSSVSQPIRLLTAKNIQRPQIMFKDKIDNSSSPFEPRIKEKPNALKPLAITLQLSEDGEESFSHPYEFELEHFTQPAKQMERVEPRMYNPFEETSFIMVEHEDQLPGLLQDLASCSEIAVDVEHHSYRTFQGFTCLLQISTRDKDFVIDALLLRDKLHCLNEVFTKPSIVKVFHGAQHDIEWLQRDLCVYVVNMFDTHEAAKLLNFAKLSLAFLMKHYCSVMADKHFQLADWRIRPLPDELVMYARQDTHYLLYIYDMMKNALLDAANGQKNLLHSVFQQSTEICKTRYEKPILREDSHTLLYRRSKKHFENRQLHAIRELYRWRDKISREDDESTGYVLPNHMLLQIAESLPREMQGILACCNPIPPLVRQNLLALHRIILEARDQPLVKPILAEDLGTRVSTQTWTKVNLDGALHCPHDLTYIQDFRNDLLTLLGSSSHADQIGYCVQKIQERNPQISLFEAETPEAGVDTGKHVQFICPYEQYKRVKPFIQSQEQEAASFSTETAGMNGIRQDNDGDDEQKQELTRKRKHDAESSSAEPQQGKMDNGEVHSSKRSKLEKCEGDSSSSHSTPQTRNRKRKHGRTEQEEGFQPYDYSKVDFSRFQGGSKTSVTNQRNEEKPKGKRRRRSGKNRSMTFGRSKR